MFRFKHLKWRVSLKQKQNHSLIVQIGRHNEWRTYIVMLIAFTAAFGWMSYIFVSPLFRQPSLSNAVYVLPVIAFIVTWYLVALRVGGWRAFGTEQIVVENGVLHWTRTALCWVRKLEIPTKDIAAVTAVTPSHALSNRVELDVLGRRRKIGDMLLIDETNELADRLRQAVGLVE